MTALTEATEVRAANVRHLARHQVMGLTVQFLLGMAVSLLGQPPSPREPLT